MQEGFSSKHECELFADAFEELLNAGRIADECGRHLHALWRHVADRRLHVVRNPLDKELAVLALHRLHLVVDVLHRDLATEHGGGGEIATLTRIGGGHHVLRIEHLLRELGDRHHVVLRRAARSERRKADEEEVQTRERDQIDRQLAQVRVELTREAQAARDARHHLRHEVIQIAVARVRQLQRAKADVVERLVVDAEHLIGILDQLVHRERCVVRLDDRVRHLGRRHDRECAHHAIRKVLADLRDQQRTHTTTSTTAKRVANLELFLFFEIKECLFVYDQSIKFPCCST